MDVVQFEAVFIFIYFLFFYFFNLICVSLSVLLTLLEFIIGLIFFHDGFTNLFCPFLISIYKHIYIYLPNLQPLNQLLFSFTFNTPCFLNFCLGFHLLQRSLSLFLFLRFYFTISIYIHHIYTHTIQDYLFQVMHWTKTHKNVWLGLFYTYIYVCVCLFLVFGFLFFCGCVQ